MSTIKTFIIKAICIFSLLLSFFSSSAAQSSRFIEFIDRYAQTPFLLNELDTIDKFTLYSFSDSEMRILRNALFARHGYIFKSKDLKEFFSHRSWYKPLLKDIQLSDIDKHNLDFIMELLENRRFEKLIALFKENKLPISIKSENYGDSYAKQIPEYFQEIYFNRCCPESKALDKININNKFIVILDKVIWAGTQFGIRTFSMDGTLIAQKSIGSFTGDIAGYTISTAEINKDLSIVVEKRHYERTYDGKAKTTNETLKKTVIHKYQIDKKTGSINKLE
jgi:hypothetical protein